MSMDIDATESLQFDLPIVPRSGSRSIPVDELKRRLEILAKELQSLDQETVDKDSLSSYAKDLVDSRVLNHSNKAVKALAACCLSDMLRLYAPEAPYTRPELKSIFNLFLSQLKQLESRENPNFAFHFYLLENLSTVKSIIIISDFENAEEMATEYFTCCFNVISNEPQRNVQVCMTELLAQIIEEVGPISQESIELLLEQFEKTNENDPCYMMALDLCRACTDALQRRVCQYFSDVLVSMSRSEGSTEDEEELKKVHQLIQRVHSVIPDLLLNVIPQLEEEMKVDNFHVRLLATVTIGKMFAEEGTALFRQYPSIWKTWLGRRNDKSVQIRVEWLQRCGAIYQRHGQTIPELNDCIKDKMSDPEEKVRAAACQVIGNMNLHDILYSIDKTVLEQVSMRCRDKKQPVRKEAMATLGAIYNRAFPRIYEGDDIVISKVGWIPDTLLNCMYLDDLSVMSALESTLNAFIFPENMDDASRTERLLKIHASLQQRARVAFSAYLRRHKSFVQLLSKYIQTCSTEDDMTDMEADLNAQQQAETIIKHVSSRFPDGPKTANALRRLREAQNIDTVQLLRTCIDPEAEYDIIVNARKQFERTVQDLMPGIHDAFHGILNRACLVILNKSDIPHLFQVLQDARLHRDTRKIESAQELLKEISTIFPVMYQNYAHQVVSLLLAETDPNTVNGSLELLANISTTNARFELFDGEMLNQICNFIRTGTVEQARHAAIIISNTDASDLRADIIETACRDLKVDDPKLVVKLSCLAEFALYKAAELSHKILPLLEYIKGTLMEQKTPPDENQNTEWLEYNLLPDSSKGKLAALQVLVNYLVATKDEEHPDMLADRIFALLWECLDLSCDVAVTNNTSAAETSHLRLAAAQSIIKLAHLEPYEQELTVTKFERLALTVQDSCYYVRAMFAETLMKGLKLNQIHPRYFALLFLYAHEPESDLIKQIKNYIKRRAAAEKGHSTIMETSFVVLMHILAHHPDFTVANDDLMLFVHYFEFYLSCIATPDNVSFLYHVAQKIKSSRDMVSPEHSQNSYILCDLASYLIKKKCEESSWPLNVYPQRINLQSKLYKALPAGEIQQRNLMNNFLPPTFMKLLTEKK